MNVLKSADLVRSAGPPSEATARTDNVEQLVAPATATLLEGETAIRSVALGTEHSSISAY